MRLAWSDVKALAAEAGARCVWRRRKRDGAAARVTKIMALRLNLLTAADD
jgi:hypothetical protein